MNCYMNPRNGALLAIAALALTGGVASAEEKPVAEPQTKNIVVAKVTTSAAKPVQQTDRQVHGPAVAQALQGVAADNKLALDLRLSGHKSVLIAAD